MAALKHKHLKDNHMSYEQMIEDQEYEFNARYDYVSEAYGDLGDDPETLRGEMEDRMFEWVCAEAELDLAFGPKVTVRAEINDDIPF